MADAQIGLDKLKCTGKAECVGGTHPDPPLDNWPLLAWSPKHPRHGAKVVTEDGAATVEDIAREASTTPWYEALADKFRTTPAHVAQAIDYAVKAGFLKGQ